MDADIEEVVLDDVVEIGCHENEVHAAEAQLSYAEKYVDQSPATQIIAFIRKVYVRKEESPVKNSTHNLLGHLPVLPQPLRSSSECHLHHLREPHRRFLRPPTQFMRTTDQHVHAVGANHPHQQRPEESHSPAGIPESVRHRKDTGADVALQQVDHRVKVGGRVVQLALEEGIVVVVEVALVCGRGSTAAGRVQVDQGAVGGVSE